MMLQEYRPDLIVLDVMLPDINGKAVCQKVRADATMDEVRIVCISGMVEEDRITELRAAGANDFMHKPFEIDRLVGRICEVARHRGRRQQLTSPCKPRAPCHVFGAAAGRRSSH